MKVQNPIKHGTASLKELSFKRNKPTDAVALAKWEIKNAKALALIKSSVNDEMYVHIENATDAWSALKTF